MFLTEFHREASLLAWPRSMLLAATAAALGGATSAHAGDPFESAEPPALPAEVRDGPLPAEIRRGSFLAVPIPTSNPTIGTGLIGVTAYFWPQDAKQADVQPPSVTGLVAMYTDTESWALGIGHNAYWDEDRWRLSAGLGTINLNLPLLAGDSGGVELDVDWEIEGEFLSAELSRAFGEAWYAGLAGRYLNFEQTFSLGLETVLFDLLTAVEATSVGPVVVRDSRDSTTYPRGGSYFKAGLMYTWRGRQTDEAYRSIDLAFSSFHLPRDNLVLAWRANWCERQAGAPLWDSCRVGLRGFPATNYLGRSSYLAEVEARWQISERWGAVAFGGAGQVRNSFSGLEDSDTIPSVGLGLRFLVQKAQHINLRLDYARSDDEDAIYFFVGEAF
jgi:hypothetical protein